MPRIELTTYIRSDIKVVFDLSRSVDLHKISTKQTNEEAVAGKTNGLIGLSDRVTWRAKHFGITQKLTSEVTEFESPTFFVDEMVKGAFKHFRHEHLFSESAGLTKMVDIFDYTSPMGVLGKLADKVFLKNYMTRLLAKRNDVIREFAEGKKWKEVPGLLSIPSSVLPQTMS